MKRLKLPKNKFARVGVKAAINSGFIAIWLIFMPEVIMKPPVLAVFMFLIGLAVLILPMVLVTKYIWFPKRPKSTRSKD